MRIIVTVGEPRDFLDVFSCDPFCGFLGDICFVLLGLIYMGVFCSYVHRLLF